MNCNCGRKIEITFPATLIGITSLHTFVVQIQCECGQALNTQLDTLKPYIADRSETFPAKRGEYHINPEGNVNFNCPICKGGFGLKPSPVHSINEKGKVAPSVVCPYGCGFHAWTTLKNWQNME